jgi:hypothetical protein
MRYGMEGRKKYNLSFRNSHFIKRNVSTVEISFCKRKHVKENEEIIIIYQINTVSVTLCVQQIAETLRRKNRTELQLSLAAEVWTSKGFGIRTTKTL